MAGAPRLRRAVRVLLLDEEDHVLLLRVTAPMAGRTLWIAPGGGLEDGEDARVTARAKSPRRPASRPSSSVRRSGMTPEERADLTGFRWWTLDDLTTTSDVLAPRDLAARLRQLLAEGPPPEPIAIGT